jgi:hypothetical protein
MLIPARSMGFVAHVEKSSWPHLTSRGLLAGDRRRSPEKFTLWPSLEDLRNSVRSRCHFCTIVWRAISEDIAGYSRTDEEISNLGIREVVLRISKTRNIQIDGACRHALTTGTGHIRVSSCDRELTPRNTTHPTERYFLTSSNEHVKLARYWFMNVLQSTGSAASLMRHSCQLD